MKKNINNYHCRFCNSKKITEIIHFGEVGLAGGFLLPNEFVKEKNIHNNYFSVRNASSTNY